jgi:hypothetical protein
MSGSSELVVAAITDPPINISAHVTSIGLGPYMSPSRPNTGVAMAAVNSVTVIAHAASEGLLSNNFGSSGISGTISVCISDTLMPAAESTAMRTLGCREVSADSAPTAARRTTARTVRV